MWGPVPRMVGTLPELFRLNRLPPPDPEAILCDGAKPCGGRFPLGWRPAKLAVDDRGGFEAAFNAQSHYSRVRGDDVAGASERGRKRRWLLASVELEICAAQRGS